MNKREGPTNPIWPDHHLYINFTVYETPALLTSFFRSCYAICIYLLGIRVGIRQPTIITQVCCPSMMLPQPSSMLSHALDQSLVALDQLNKKRRRDHDNEASLEDDGEENAFGKKEAYKNIIAFATDMKRLPELSQKIHEQILEFDKRIESLEKLLEAEKGFYESFYEDSRVPDETKDCQSGSNNTS
ncbi:hypothetical protein BT63DRAFT_483718 [Microthyrium microscopicum]|uniref:Uncharacterized protein n=1 Tax=Microthyrium microscopicum TaxID=703497 RepID=A0A6A6TZ51_9PEZI|nr:hypothetical protein BT63DRAFT_483718 [Microthyrium microscopicum]